MTEPFLRTVDLVKEYRIGPSIVHALAGVSVDVDSGEFVAVMGPSGSGKTTFMNLLGCLDTPTSGSYLLEGAEISKMNSDELAHVRNRRIGFVFQSFNLLPRISAIENVALPLAYGNHRRRLRREMAAKALEEVGLADRMDHTPTQLSGGQQQRVAIARALVAEPSLILADEPTGALDTRTGAEIMGLMQGLHARGITIVLVTHERDIADYAQRVLHFRDGVMHLDERQVPRATGADVITELPGALARAQATR